MFSAMIPTMICLGSTIVARSQQAVISSRACKRFGRQIADLTDLLRAVQLLEQELGLEFLQGLVELMQQMKRASRLMERACKMPWIYRVIKANDVNSRFEAISQNLGVSLMGLHTCLVADGIDGRFRVLRADLIDLEHRFRCAVFPLERKELQLFRKTQRTVNQSYRGRIAAGEAVQMLRETIQRAVGAERLKAEAGRISKQLFQDIEIAREGDCSLEEHANRQLLMAINSVDRAPPEFFCPLGLTVMTNPVVLVETGVTYERESIDIWLNDYGYRVCPVTGLSLRCDGVVDIVENKSLRGLIREWLRGNDCRRGSIVLDTRNLLEEGLDDDGSMLTYSQMESEEFGFTPENTPTHDTSDFLTARSVQPIWFWEEQDPTDIFYATQGALERMQEAARNGDVEVLRTLSREAKMLDDANQDGMGFLHLAASCGQEGAVRYLISLRLGINRTTQRDSWTPVYLAALGGHASVVRTLLENNADITRTDATNGWTPLHAAANHGHVEVASELLHHAIKKKMRQYIDAPAKDGCSAVHLAVCSGKISLVELMLQYTLNMNKTCQGGKTALHYALEKEIVSITELLLDVGIDPNIQSKNGITPLHIAQRRNNLALGEMLLQRGANPDLAGKDGMTPLHLAIIANHAEFARMLVLEGGADFRKKTKPFCPGVARSRSLRCFASSSDCESGNDLPRRRRPLQLAKDYGHVELQKFLRRRSMSGFWRRKPKHASF
ncbi:hypothetical protein BSKO_05424 [Bryopsis sp. KO-2023]|nr:hypothetical protein BSKO_05424 [Bryopsis sp. KO-2023]